MINVGVKFCGNCNPDIDGIALLARLKEEARGKANFVNYDSGQIDLILILSGCPVDCTDRMELSGPMVVVAGETVQLKYCPESSLPQVVLGEIFY